MGCEGDDSLVGGGMEDLADDEVASGWVVLLSLEGAATKNESEPEARRRKQNRKGRTRLTLPPSLSTQRRFLRRSATSWPLTVGTTCPEGRSRRRPGPRRSGGGFFAFLFVPAAGRGGSSSVGSTSLPGRTICMDVSIVLRREPIAAIGNVCVCVCVCICARACV